MPQVAAANTLEALLTDVAQEIQKKTARLLRVRTKLTNEFLSAEDCRHESLTAAFEAFTVLGGDPDNHLAFDWTGQRDALALEAKRIFQRTLTGKQSMFGDVRARMQVRPDRMMNAQDSWDAWRETMLPMRGLDKVENWSREYLSEAQQEREYREMELEGLFVELRAILAEEELHWLRRVYWDGASVADCGRELVAAGRYDEELKATNYLYKVLHRARKRAAALLSPKWRTLFAESA